MTECQQCSRKAQLFLCQGCMTDLREMLQGLAARWLTYLQDSALGQTRLGDAVRHRRGDEQPMRLNLKAADLLSYTRSVLSEWIRDLCETRGVQVPALSATVDMALWLARNVSAIAADEGAGVCYREIKGIVEDIERVINRPVPPVFCGPCPTINEDRSPCEANLHAKRGEVEVKCWKCKATYNVQELIGQALDRIDELLYSARDVLLLMAEIGEPISARTWRYWRAEQKLVVRGERDGEPMYWISDVRDLMAQRPQKVATGGAARRSA